MINFDNVKDISAEEYFKNNKYAVDMFLKKYSHKKEDGTKETPAEVFWRISSELAEFEDDINKKQYKEKWFSLMYEGWFRPGGSIMNGINSPQKCSLANCTTIPVEDDTLEAINKAEYVLMKCAAYRQGMGMDLSNLRPRNSLLGNAASKSTGAVPWADKYNNVGEYVGQEGRKPAILLSLKDSHPDIEEFITCKLDTDKMKNANISVQISNKFMETLKAKKKWELYFKTQREEIKKKIDPKVLFDLIAETAYISAEPGVQFIDLLRQGTMSNAIYEATEDPIYKVISTNACSEKPLAGYNICNLLSINMEMFSTDEEEYKKQLEDIVPLLVRLSDNVIEYELTKRLSPVKQQEEILRKTREIGLGITNLHGWFLKSDIQYDSDEGIEKAENFFKWYAYNTFKASMFLGLEKGNAPAFDEIPFKQDLMKSIYFANVVNEFFDGDPKKVKYMRNMAHMSIAPTGSLSNSFPVPCISSGIEPIIAPYYWRKTRAISAGAWDYYFVIPDRVKDYILSKMDVESDDYKMLSKFNGSELDNNGEIGLSYIECLKKHLKSGFFKPAHEIDYNKKIDLMSGVYKWVDAAISCTFNLPESSTKEDVANIYMTAYEKGVRAVSVYREGSREGVLIFEDPVTNKRKQAKKDTICKERPEEIGYSCAPKRPKILPCDIHHCSVKGEKWLVLVGMLNGEPYEIFAGEQEDIYIPRSVKEGEIVKKGGGKYSLRVKVRRSVVEYDDIAHELMSAEQRSLTRLLSLGLRHGIPHEFITSQLKKANGDITDFSSVVSRIIGKYIKEFYFSKGEVCPQCNNLMVVVGGCLSCITEGCGYSKCG